MKILKLQLILLLIISCFYSSNCYADKASNVDEAHELIVKDLENKIEQIYFDGTIMQAKGSGSGTMIIKNAKVIKERTFPFLKGNLEPFFNSVYGTIQFEGISESGIKSTFKVKYFYNLYCRGDRYCANDIKREELVNGKWVERISDVSINLNKKAQIFGDLPNIGFEGSYINTNKMMIFSNKHQYDHQSIFEQRIPKNPKLEILLAAWGMPDYKEDGYWFYHSPGDTMGTKLLIKDKKVVKEEPVFEERPNKGEIYNLNNHDGGKHDYAR